MSISASDVMKLRAMTGAGMMDCKNALEEAGGDMDKAAELLRKKGIVKAAKRAEKVAADGLITVASNAEGTVAAMAEINCETDFVAKSTDFTDFAKHIAEAALENDPKDLASFMDVQLSSSQSVMEGANHVTLKSGEKVAIRRFARLAAANGKVYSYLHGTKIGVLVEMEGGDQELGTDIAMHIAASNPKYLDRSVVDSSDLEKEREVYVAQLKQQGKPDNIIENIVKGKIDKFYSEVCLLEQAFIKNEDMTVAKLLESKGAKVIRFARFELGEGIEKNTKDFASEVAEQLK